MSDDRLNLTEVDFEITDETTIVLVRPCNDWACDWINENVENPQWWGDRLVVEPRFVEGLIELSGGTAKVV